MYTRYGPWVSVGADTPDASRGGVMRATKMLQSRPFRVGLLALAILAASVAGSIAYKRYQANLRETELKEVFAAMQQYVEVSPGNYYPLRSAEPGIFLPDFDEWEKLAPDKAAFQRAKQILTRERARPLCYLGYAFTKDTFGLAILDRVESDAKSFRGGGPVRESAEWILDVASSDIDELHSLRRNVERNFAWDFVWHGSPPREGELEDWIPVIWEMPRGTSDRICVLRMSGRVGISQYPGEFPMSPLFVNRLRGLMGLPKDPGFRDDAPIIPILREIMYAFDHQQTYTAPSLVHFDVAPSVTATGSMGYRITIGSTDLVLFPTEDEAPRFDAAEFFHKSVWWYSARQTPGVFLGLGHGYHWYGKVDYPNLLLLRNTFELTSGDELYETALVYFWNTWVIPWWCVEGGNSGEDATHVESARNLTEYALSYMRRRSKEGTPIDEDLIGAGAILEAAFREGYGNYSYPTPEVQGEASERLVRGSEADPEAAVLFAMLHTLRYRARTPRDDVRQEGLDLLRKLPRAVVLRVVEDMASRIQQPDEAEACRRVLEELNRVPADGQVQAR